MGVDGEGVNRHHWKPLRLGAAAALLAIAAATTAFAEDGARISAPGKYAGYTSALYDGYARESVYVPVRDGTRLAIDIHRPTLGGKVVDQKLPVVWMHTPYNRRGRPGQPPAAQAYAGNALELVKYGYVVATVDFRGLQGSFGVNRGYVHGPWTPDSWFDAYDVTEWLARQAWSTGRIGMWGCSATGGAAIQAALTAPPSLKAIMAMSAPFDSYRWAAPGGMAPPTGSTFQPGTGDAWRAAVIADPAAAVDGPDGAALLAQAKASRAGSTNGPGFTPFRDSRSPDLGVDRWWIRESPYDYVDALRRSGIGIYAALNWDERQIKLGSFLLFANLPRQTKLLAGPQAHCQWDRVRQENGLDIVTEERRFFDYWLKDVQNGVMEEPRVTYFTYNAPADQAWRTAKTWPLPEETRTRFYLGDGALSASRPSIVGADARAVDYETIPADVPPPSNRLEKGIVYISAPLDADMEMTGHPSASIWLSSTSTDADLIATIEDVAPDGTAVSRNVFGMLRASRRAPATPPYDNLGLPWQSHLARDVRPLKPGVPVKMEFDIMPISHIFKKGHRVRLVLTVADRDRTPRETPAPTVTIHRGAKYPSFIALPIVKRAPG